MKVNVEIVEVNVLEYLLLLRGVDVAAGPAVERAEERWNCKKFEEELFTNPLTLVQSNKLQAGK